MQKYNRKRAKMNTLTPPPPHTHTHTYIETKKKAWPRLELALKKRNTYTLSVAYLPSYRESWVNCWKLPI